MSRLDKYLITEDKNTDFMETCSCVGIVCNKSLSNRIKKLIDTQEGDTQKLLDDMKNVAGSGSYDWNKSGVSQIHALTLDNPSRINVAFNLLVGMNIFMQDVGYGIAGTKPYFIHNSIDTFYKAEKQTFGSIPYTKNNTADCVISNIPHTKLLKSLPDGAQADKSLQFIEMISGDKYVQVSLKKDNADAQLGKVTKLIKSMYGVDSTASVSQRLGECNLSEGIWDKIKSVGSKVWGKLKSSLGKFSSFISKKFKKVNTKHLSDFEKAMGVNEGKMNTKTANMVDAVLKSPERAVMLVNNEVKKLQQMITTSNVPVKANLTQKFKVTSAGDVFKLIGNYLTLRMLQEMMADEKKLNMNINRIIGEMFFGGTKMPLWKVFGYFGTNAYQYMGTLDAFVDKPKDTTVETMGVRINNSGSFYTIMIYLLDDVNEKGKSYITLRTGTNSSTRVSFIVEGTKKIGPFDHDKSLLDII